MATWVKLIVTDEGPTLAGTTELRQEDAGWWTVSVDWNDVGHLYWLGAHPTEAGKGVGILCAPEEYWSAWSSLPQWSLPSLEDTTDADALIARRMVKWWRMNGTETKPPIEGPGVNAITNDIRQVTIPMPETMPTPQNPWVIPNPDGELTIHELIRPVLDADMGQNYPQAAEETP